MNLKVSRVALFKMNIATKWNSPLEMRLKMAPFLWECTNVEAFMTLSL